MRRPGGWPYPFAPAAWSEIEARFSEMAALHLPRFDHMLAVVCSVRSVVATT